MAQHNVTGKYGEMLAIDFLEKNGFFIIEKNWRYKHLEVDIIASRNSVLHFIEVKTRKTNSFGHPEEGIHLRKMKLLMAAATEYLFRNNQWNRIQYDALSISIAGRKVSYFFIEDIFI